jgi:hypothetical protein
MARVLSVLLAMRLSLTTGGTLAQVHLRLDWDVSWTDAAPSPNRPPDSVYRAASRLPKGLEEIIQADARRVL